MGALAMGKMEATVEEILVGGRLLSIGVNKRLSPGPGRSHLQFLVSAGVEVAGEEGGGVLGQGALLPLGLAAGGVQAVQAVQAVQHLHSAGVVVLARARRAARNRRLYIAGTYGEKSGRGLAPTCRPA